MPSKNHNQFTAGLFIVVSFAVAAAIFFGITGSSLLDGPYKTYRVAFDLTEDVGGLAVGSEVRIGGVTVGKVDKIDVVTVDPAGRSIVQADFSMSQRYAVRKDAVVDVQAPLTGVPNLNITSLGSLALATEIDLLDGKTGGLSRAIDQIATVGDAAEKTLSELRPRLTGLIEDLQPRAAGAIDQIKTTAAAAEGTITQARTKIDPAYEKFAALAEAARSAMANLDEILGGGKGDLRKTIADLAETMGAFRQKVPGLLDRATGAIDDLRGSLAKTSELLEDAKATAANTRALTGDARSILASNRTRIDDIIKSLKLTGENLGAASGEIRRSPWRLLYTPKDNEVANGNLYDATRQFAEASRKLQDSATALRDLTSDPNANANKEQVQKILDALNQDFAEYRKVEATLWDRVKP